MSLEIEKPKATENKILSDEFSNSNTKDRAKSLFLEVPKWKTSTSIYFHLNTHLCLSKISLFNI